MMKKEQTTPANGSIEVGDKIKFGAYSWLVLDVQDGKALILSDMVMEEHRTYHDAEKYENITWETCTLRQYLNGEFYNNFSAEEKARIAKRRIPNKDNPWFGTKGGNATNDHIFLLSLEEVVKYFGDSGQLRNKNPNNSNYIDDQYNSARIAMARDREAWLWMLRSPGYIGFYASYVDDYGRVDFYGDVVNGTVGVRPALWLNL